MTKRGISFKRAYLIYLGVLAALAAAAVGYVYFLLRDYEASQPEQRVWEAVDELSAQAAGGTFWEAYPLPQPTPGQYEAGQDVRQAYLALYGDRAALTLARSEGSVQGETVEYQVEYGGVPLARVGLRAQGEPETRLAVFTTRDWAVDYVRPELEARDYTLTLPAAFSVSLNGTPLSGTEGEDGDVTYTVSGLYLPPDFAITDEAGGRAAYTIRDGKVLAEYFHYTLTLPDALTVRVNGEPWPGQEQGGSRVRYEIALLQEPEVLLSDCFGNEVRYQGGDELPLTSCTITASEGYTVTVDGAPVPEAAVTRRDNPDYQHFAAYVDGLPQLCTYSVAILKDGAQVAVADPEGNPVPLAEGEHTYDFSQPSGGGTVPDEVSGEIDVLKAAQDWSLFLTQDLAFSRIRDYLIPGSYQYEVAWKYATGEDITFTSAHTLLDPAFTGNTVANFTWITGDCFSVDISFVKHMRLRTGKLVDDPMNDRFYFVRYDDPESGEGPAWKLASMKEILNDGDV